MQQDLATNTKRFEAIAGTDKWVSTDRCPDAQNSKVHGCDHASSGGSELNLATSTNGNVALGREVAKVTGKHGLAASVMGEKSAYRQIPLAPRHRKLSIETMWVPLNKKPAYFGMIGHGFGLLAAVFNFDRRSAAFNDILLKFGLMDYFDHHYGLRPATIIDEDLEIVKEIATLLGSDLGIHKCEAGKCVDSSGHHVLV